MARDAAASGWVRLELELELLLNSIGVGIRRVVNREASPDRFLALIALPVRLLDC